MSEWLAIDQWRDCVARARPGEVAEVRNAAGQRVLTPCVPSPPRPWDWTGPAVAFRIVPAPAPRHSSPMPEPAPKGSDSGR